MAQNKTFRLGPLALTTTLTTNLLNPPTATGGVNGGSSAQYIILKHIRITNTTTSSATFSLWLGATGGNVAGTAIGGGAQIVPANSSYDMYTQLRLDSTDFLVGGAGTGSALTIFAVGEIGVSG